MTEDMDRRSFLNRFLAAGSAAAASSTLAPFVHAEKGRSASPPNGRNVVVIVSDDHGKHAGCYGNDVVQTPNIDALAEESTKFTRGFATTASCSASRSVILTGLHNHRTAQYGHMHDYAHFSSYDNLWSLPVMMDHAGYRTLLSGKFHVAPEEVYHFNNYMPDDQRNPVKMANKAKDFVTADSEQPFLWYFATSDPHRGGGLQAGGAAGEAEARFEDLPYAPNSFGNRPQGYEGVEEVTYGLDEVIVPPWLPDNDVTRAELTQYYRSVSRLDQGVGRIIEILKEAGVYEDTLIIYMSDHGIAFPGAKTTTYEPGLNSPLIVRHPDASRRGITSNAMISWVDITPTILDFAGIEQPTYNQHIHLPRLRKLMPETHQLHGNSFLPILEQEAPEGWDQINASHTFHEIQMYYPMRVVHDRQWKLIWNIAHGLPFPFASDLWVSATWQNVYEEGMDAMYGVRTVDEYIHRPAFELYDMEEDPWESNNLAGEEQYADVLEEYRGKIQDFQIRTSDPWYLKWQYE